MNPFAVQIRKVYDAHI